MIYVILCGGSGTRLWPLSTNEKPKQFHSLLDNDGATLLQNTYHRLNCDHETIIVTNCDHQNLIMNQTNNYDNNMCIYEPFGRNTAPAIITSCLLHKKINPNDDQVFIVASSDHSFDNEKFNTVINEAIELANHGKIVTLGVNPTKPETGYGYIKKDLTSNKILQFVEKPSIKVAEEYLDDGNYYWNSGTFIFKRNVMINAFKKHAPQVFDSCSLALKHSKYNDFQNELNLNEKYYEQVQDISIDYAIMEKIDNGSVVVFDGHWSDIGSWNNLHDLSEKNKDGNYINTNDDKSTINTYNTTNSYLRSDNSELIVIGLDNVVVINHKGKILVCNQDNSQDIKKALKPEVNLCEQSESVLDLQTGGKITLPNT